MQKSNILGVGITTEKEDKILEYIIKDLGKPKKKRQKIVIFTPNPEQISQASRDEELKTLLNQAEIALPDGVFVPVAARLLGEPIDRRITGVDFMKSLVKTVSAPIKSGSEQPVVTGYLGGQRGVAEKAANCLRKIYPNLRVGYTSEAYDRQRMIRSDIDILFVALGFPKQEKWIIEHKDEIPATVLMGVGGAFDFISWAVPRAPKFVRDIGFEWLFRLTIQPWRFKRQLQIWHFAGLIFARALSNRVKKMKNER